MSGIKIEFYHADLIAVVAIAVVMAALILLWQRTRNKILVFWRTLILISLLFLIFRPELIMFSGKNKPLIGILVDSSRSMSITGRLKQVEEFFILQQQTIK